MCNFTSRPIRALTRLTSACCVMIIGLSIWAQSPDAQDTSNRPIRALTARVNWGCINWNEPRQQATGRALSIDFSGPAAPADLLGKAALANTVKLTPEVPGRWRWDYSTRLGFEPQGLWLAPRTYEITFSGTGLMTDCKVLLQHTNWADMESPRLTAVFGETSFYVDPSTPSLQQLTATVLFSQPVALDEVRRHFTVKNLSTTPLFTEGGQPQVVADEKNPLRFFLRSPLIKPGDKEDLVRFDITKGLIPLTGGDPTAIDFTVKLTAPSRYSAFYFKEARPQLVNNAQGDPQQFVFFESSIDARGADIAKLAEAWRLPPPPPEGEPWSATNVTANVIAKATRVPLTYMGGDHPAPVSTWFGFRLPAQEPGPLYVRIPKETAAPGGFSTREEFAAIIDVPEFPKSAQVLGRGGILALNGERKLNLKSRGYAHLKYTLGRIPADQINHLVSQTKGNFENPEFRGSFGFEDIAHFHQSVQDIGKKNDYEANYSSFDFGPALTTGEPAETHGLFYLVVQGVRRRTAEDRPPGVGDDPEWIMLPERPHASDEDRYYRRNDRSDEELSYEQEEKEMDRRFVLITDLGVIVKANAGGSRDVYVQSFSAREPVAGVQLTALARNGEVLQTATTDAQGHASLTSLEGLQREQQPVALVARKDADLAFLAWSRSDRHVETSRFDTGGVNASDGAALNAFLFTERGIYRPGDPIQLATIVRQRDWAGTLTGLPVEVVLMNAKEEEAGRFPLALGADGFNTISLPTAETAPTGVWRIELQRPAQGRRGEDSALGHTFVRVEEFQPNRLKLTTHFSPAPDTAAWVSPEQLSAEVELQTLFGIAAEDRRVTGKLRLTPAAPVFAQWPDWTFALPKADHVSQMEMDLGETKTDADGKASFTLAMEAHTAPLLRATVELEGFEADGGRGVSGSLQTLVSHQTHLLGWKANGDLHFIPKGVPRAFQIQAIGPDAKLVAAPGLKRVLVETHYVSVLTKQNNGTLAYLSVARDRELETVDGSLPASAVKVDLPVTNVGDFRYEWRDVLGVGQCTVAFNIVGTGEPTRSLERDSELELTLPDQAWKPGEPLSVSLKAPFAGAGLLTIEREKVLAAQWFKSDAAASVQQITVPAGLEGGAYVHVTFVRALDSPEVFTNPLSTGVAAFRVVQDRRHLAVTLDAPAGVRPGERVVIGYSTPRPARILVWAVDEGIHRVTNYTAPQPLTELLHKPALEVETYQLLDLLMPEFTLLKKALATGGDGLEPPELKLGLNPFKRKRAAPIVFWSGLLECGPERHEVAYQVPDYFAGALNIMATAVALDAVGVAQQHTIVKGPFVLTPNAPFFAAPGDEFTASVTVANQLEGAATTDQIHLKAECTGGITMVEQPAELATIPVGKEVTLHFRLQATPELGNAEITFTSTAAGESVSQRSTLSVRPGTLRAAVVQSGWFRADDHTVAVEHDFYPQFAQREAVISTTPLGLARGLATYLREYPHGCSEQITSRAWPWLVLRDDANFGMEKAEATKAIQSAISQLSRRQGANGGFGYWGPENGGDFDFLSIYVTQFLTEAKAGGFAVPGPMFDAALRHLRHTADAKLSPPERNSNGGFSYWQTQREANLQAAAIYLLTRNEEVTTNYALKLSDFLAAKVPPEIWHRDSSAAWLAATWRLLKQEPEAKQLMELHRTARARPAPKLSWADYYDSPLTNEAMIFTILCRHFPEIAGKFGYEELQPLTAMIESGDFHTLSAAWSVQALKAYAGLAKASGVKAGIAQAGKTLAEPAAGLLTAKLNAGSARFFLARTADVPRLGAWFQTIETGFDHVVPTKAEAHTLEAYHEITDLKGQPVALAKVGDFLLVNVTVRNLGAVRQPHLALTELLPGGFDFAPQTEEHALRPGLTTLPGTEYVDVREDRALLFCELNDNQTRTFTYAVRPTCAGSFTVPPAYAESMYDQAVHGHGVGGKFTVLPRE